MAKEQSKAVDSPSFGLLLIVVGVLTLFLSSHIEAPAIGDENDPGPAGLPTAVAIMLLGGGTLLAANWIRKSGTKTASTWLVQAPARLRHAFAGSSRLNVWFALMGLTAYVVMIPWAGFSISTLLFGISMMIRLGSRWWLALLVSLLAVAIIRLVFVMMFDVYLPERLLE